MSLTTLSIQMDSDVKNRFEALCAEFGMPTSTAIELFAKTFIQEGRLPSEEEATDPFYSQSNMQYLKCSIRQMEEGKIVTKTMEELEEMADTAIR